MRRDAREAQGGSIPLPDCPTARMAEEVKVGTGTGSYPTIWQRLFYYGSIPDCAINYGLNKVRFYTPVPVGAKIRARATVLQARSRGGALLLTSEVRLEVEGERKPACVAETLGMYFFDD